MTYTVSSGTLNPTQLNTHYRCDISDTEHCTVKCGWTRWRYMASITDVQHRRTLTTFAPISQICDEQMMIFSHHRVTASSEHISWILRPLRSSVSHCWRRINRSRRGRRQRGKGLEGLMKWSPVTETEHRTDGAETICALTDRDILMMTERRSRQPRRQIDWAKYVQFRDRLGLQRYQE